MRYVWSVYGGVCVVGGICVYVCIHGRCGWYVQVVYEMWPLLEQLWWANRGLRADFTDQPSTFCSVPLHLASAVLLRSQGVNECQWSESAPSSSLPSLCLLSTGHCVLPGHPALTVCEGASGIFLCVWSVRMVCVWCGMHGVCVCTVAV